MRPSNSSKTKSTVTSTQLKATDMTTQIKCLGMDSPPNSNTLRVTPTIVRGINSSINIHTTRTSHDLKSTRKRTNSSISLIGLREMTLINTLHINSIEVQIKDSQEATLSTMRASKCSQTTTISTTSQPRWRLPHLSFTPRDSPRAMISIHSPQALSRLINFSLRLLSSWRQTPLPLTQML